MTQLRIGDVVANRFEIDRAIGSGGMGSVYLAHDRLSGHCVALKLLHGEGAAGSDNDRFIREAQLLSELHHPGIVSHVAHGQTSHGQRFLAMEWLDGQDLAQRLQHGPLLLSDALLLIKSVATAIAFAHQRGIVHRDLKPTNLFLPGGDIARVKILDFGIARRTNGSKAMTRTGMVIGTPEYMAPEQARGIRELTPAADVFSLGCILYHCLTGDPPFAADHIAAVLVRILFDEPTPVAVRRPGIPDAVCQLLNRMLAKDAERRIGNAAEVAAAIDAICEVPNLPLTSTLDGPARPCTLTSSEQILLSLVLALSPLDAEANGTTVIQSEVFAELAQHGTLLTELRALGAQADMIVGCAFVVIVPQMASAKDQATLAARCAAVVKERWPEARVVGRHRPRVSGQRERERRGPRACLESA